MSKTVRYEPHERPPHALAAALGAQVVILIISGIMISPLTVGRAAGLDQAGINWLVFAAMIACGLSTMLQATRIGIIGGGYALFVGSNVAFVGVSVSAINSGGLPLLVQLVCVASLFTFLFTAQLAPLRKILTPAVGGVVLMLMSMSVAPVVWNMLANLPPGFEGSPAGPISALATLAPIVLISLFAKGILRLWAPLLGVIIGSAVAWALGMADTTALTAAPWIGLPEARWPGVAVAPTPQFWALLPAFVLITFVGGIETFADGIAVQRSAWRSPKPIDFRAVQGSINADGVGSFIAGLLGTVPNTVYSMSVGILEMTGVAARRVAWWGGLFLLLLAFSPKLASLVASMPNPVAGAYILIVLVLLFGHGLRMTTEEELGFEAGIAVCLGFWVGIGFQGGYLYNDMLPSWMQLFLANGTTSGGLTAILLMALFSLRQRAQHKVTVPLAISSFGEIRTLMQRHCSRLGWDRRAEDRLILAAEEAFLFMLENQTRDAGAKTQLHVRLREREGDSEFEYITAPAGTNVEEAAMALGDAGDSDPEKHLTLRLLRGMAKELKHLQYHGTDYLVVRVDSSGGGRAAEVAG